MKRFYNEEKHSVKFGMGCYEVKIGYRKVNPIWRLLYTLGFINKDKAISKIKDKCMFSMIASEEIRPKLARNNYLLM